MPLGNGNQGEKLPHSTIAQVINTCSLLGLVTKEFPSVMSEGHTHTPASGYHELRK